MLTRFLGLVLMLGGIAVLSSNIIITTRGLMIKAPAIFLCSAGILLLIYGRSYQNWGWLAIGLGVVLTFASGGIVIAPTTLLVFLLYFLSIVGGYKLFTTGRF